MYLCSAGQMSKLLKHTICCTLMAWLQDGYFLRNSSISSVGFQVARKSRYCRILKDLFIKVIGMLFSFSDILAATSNGNFNGSFGNKVKPPLAIAAGNKSKEPGKTKKI